jgi:hypothetical protein
MRWYIDDELYLTVNDWFTAVEGEEEKPYPAPFNQTFFVQLNLAVGGTWPGNPDETTNFDNAEFLIDYVRVYQKPEYDTNVQKPAKNYKEADATGNFITMGDFSDPSDLGTDLAEEKDWTFLLFEGGEGSASIEDGTMVIKTDAEGTVDYSVQLVQPGLPMIKGHNYKLTFECWADEERDLITCVSAPTAGWVRFAPQTRASSASTAATRIPPGSRTSAWSPPSCITSRTNPHTLETTYGIYVAGGLRQARGGT